MATVTQLQFKISSAYDGGAVDRARESISALNRDLDALSNKSVKVTVNVDNSALTRLRTDLDNFSRMRATAEARVDAQTAGLDAARANLDRFGAMRVTAHANVDTDAAHTALTRLLADSDNSTNHLHLLGNAGGDAGALLTRMGGDAGGASGGIGQMSSASSAGSAGLGGLASAAGIAALAIMAIGPVAALTSAAVIGGLGTAFIGVGALVLSKTKEISETMKKFKTQLEQDMGQAALAMKSQLLAGINELMVGLHKLTPAFTQAFAASGKLIQPLVESLLGFTRSVMPGVITALRAAGPVFEGLKTGMTALGQGMSQMFAGMAAGAKGAGAALSVTLGGIGKILASIGVGFGQMAAAGAKALGGLMTGLTALVSGAMKGFVGAVKAMDGSLGPFLATIGKVAGQILSQMLPVFARLIAQVMTGLIPVLKALAPALITVGTAVGGALLQALRVITPFLGTLAQTFAKILIALTPLIPPLTKILVAGLQVLVAVLKPLMPLLVLMAQLVAKLAPVINLAAIAITALSKGVQVAIGWITNWKNVTQAFSIAWNAIWNALKIATLAIWNALGVAFKAMLSGLTAAWNVTGAALKVAWNAVWNAMSVAAKAIWTAMQAAWNAVCVAFRTLWQAAAAALQASWNALWTAMKAVGQAAWTAMQAAWNAMCTAFRTIEQALSTAMQAVWNAMWTAIRAVYNAAAAALEASWRAFSAAFQAVAHALDTAFRAIWNAMWAAIRAIYNAAAAALEASWRAFSSAFQTIAHALDSAFRTIWTGMWNAIKTIANAAWSALKSSFNAFSSAFQTATKALMNALKVAWDAGAKAIGAAWNAIKKLVRDPIQAVVTVVYNNGIVKLWNAVAGVFGAPKLSGFTLPNFATGGPVYGPGGPTEDRVLARLSPGEHVWTAAEVQAAGGHHAMLAMREQVMGGGAYKAAAQGDGSVKGSTVGGFALGGIIPNPINIIKDIGKGISTAFNAVSGFAGDVLGQLAKLALGSIAPVINPLIQKAADAGKKIVKDIIPGSPWLETLIAGGNKPTGVTNTGGSNPQDVSTAAAASQGALGTGGGMIQMMADAIKNWITANDAPVGGGNTADAQKWADAQVGKPYSLGSFGSAFDCSSYMSGIASIILGKKPGPMFTTFAFTGAKQGPATFEKDLKAPFMVGVENRGIGHMAGTLNGKNYEATPPKVRSGPGARGAHDPMFDMVYGMKASEGGGQGVIPTGQHLAVIDAALKAAGVPPPGTLAQWEAGLNTLITRESAWNSSAINKTDSNAAAGHPSQGLAQVIPSTFAAFHVAGTSTNILDPVANVAAAIRYIISRYGNITNVQQANASLPPKGYWTGTSNARPGWHMIDENGDEWINFRGGEKVMSHGRTPRPWRHHDDSQQPVIVNVENHWHGNPTKEAVQHAEGSMAEKLRQACKAGVGGRAH